MVNVKDVWHYRGSPAVGSSGGLYWICKPLTLPDNLYQTACFEQLWTGITFLWDANHWRVLQSSYNQNVTSESTHVGHPMFRWSMIKYVSKLQQRATLWSACVSAHMNSCGKTYCSLLPTLCLSSSHQSSGTKWSQPLILTHTCIYLGLLRWRPRLPWQLTAATMLLAFILGVRHRFALSFPYVCV